MSNSLWPHRLQQAKLIPFLCPPLSLGICSNSCPLSWWCRFSLTISSSAALFSFCLQSFPASGWIWKVDSISVLPVSFPQVPACFLDIPFSDCLLPCQVMSGNYWCVSSFSQQYFNKRKTYFAHDALQQCTVGDIVLLKALPVPRTKHVKHELAEIVFKVGQVVDPVTGKRCAGTTYLESPVDLEATPLAKNLEELSLSTTQWRRIGTQSQKGISVFTLWKNFSQFPHKPSSFSSGIYEITKSKWSKVFVIIFHKSLWSCFRFPSWWDVLFCYTEYA